MEEVRANFASSEIARRVKSYRVAGVECQQLNKFDVIAGVFRGLSVIEAMSFYILVPTAPASQLLLNVNISLCIFTKYIPKLLRQERSR
jgi:hypothetical protein